MSLIVSTHHRPEVLLLEIRVSRRVMAGTEVVLMKFLLMMGRVRPPLFSDRPRSLTGQSLHLTGNQRYTQPLPSSINRILPINYFRLLCKDLILMIEEGLAKVLVDTL